MMARMRARWKDILCIRKGCRRRSAARGSCVDTIALARTFPSVFPAADGSLCTAVDEANNGPASRALVYHP